MTSDEQKAVETLELLYKAPSLNPISAMPDRLYHYTSTGGLVGIVSSGVLRASNFSYLNDSAEIQYGREIARTVIKAYIESNQSSAHREVFVRAKKTLDDVGMGVEFYLACFCTEADLLSQWRSYGSAKGGFCIGFDTKALPDSGLKYSLSRALYDLGEQQHNVKQAIDSAAQALSVGSSADFLDRVHDLFTRKVIGKICFFKHPGFAEEKEWRAVHQFESADQIKFDTSSGIIKPFVDLWTCSDQRSGQVRLPIAEVIIGASVFSSQSKKALELLLNQYGYRNLEIRESFVPFRDF